MPRTARRSAFDMFVAGGALGCLPERARRVARFWSHGHTPGPATVRAEAVNPATPTTLDLRWQP